MTVPVLRVAGTVLVGPSDVRDQVWVVGGKVTFTAPQNAGEVQTVRG